MIYIWSTCNPYIQLSYDPYMVIGNKVSTLVSKYTLHCVCHLTTTLHCDKRCKKLDISQLHQIVLQIKL
jgi:hypothetical protein